MTYDYIDVHSQMRQHVRDTASFYGGIARLMEGDDDNDEGFHFLSRVFRSVINGGGECVMGRLEYYAVGHAAEFFDKHDPEIAWRRTLALHELLRAIGESDLDQAGIEALTGQVKGSPDVEAAAMA